MGTVCALAAQANEWYVDKDSTADTHDGGKTTPFLTIQEGLDAATTAGDTVHLAKGWYKIPTALTFQTNKVSLIGDDGIAANTIIDAQQLTNCVMSAYQGTRVYNLTFTNGLCQVTSAFGGGGLRLTQGNAVVSNCIVTCCAVIGTGDISLYGGGIAAYGGGELVDSLVENCCLSNTATELCWGACNGGGIYNMTTGRRSIIRNCAAYCTRSSGYNYMQGGGASGGNWYDCAFISNRLVNPLELYNCRGGGLMAAYASAVSNCYFEGNYITGKGAGAYLENQIACGNNSFIGNIGSAKAGAALHVNKASDCYFEGNVLPGGGSECGSGGLYVGGVACGCVFRNNSGDKGSAMQVNSSGSVVTNCLFDGNHCTGTGGAVYYSNQVLSPFLSDCVFVNNGSTSSGAALYMGGTANATVRSCLFVSNTVKYVMYVWEWDGYRVQIREGLSCCGRIENCTIADNTLLNSSYALKGSKYDLFQRNNLIWNNCLLDSTTSRALEDWYAGTNVVRYCYIDSNASNAESFNKDGNVIGADPKFKDAALENYRLTRNSACHNAGTNLAWMAEGAMDMGSGFRETHPTTITAFGEIFNVGVKLEKIDPRARIECGLADIGCFEYWAPSGTGIFLR